jgi:hypothetical protein
MLVASTNKADSIAAKAGRRAAKAGRPGEKMCLLQHLSQLSQVYFCSAFTHLPDITTHYRPIYKIYKHTFSNKVIKKAKPGGLVRSLVQVTWSD